MMLISVKSVLQHLRGDDFWHFPQVQDGNQALTEGSCRVTPLHWLSKLNQRNHLKYWMQILKLGELYEFVEQFCSLSRGRLRAKPGKIQHVLQQAQC